MMNPSSSSAAASDEGTAPLMNQNATAPAYPQMAHNSGQQIDFKRGERSADSAWQKAMYFQIGSSACNFFIALVLYMLIFGMGYMIEQHDDYTNVTILTQGYTDWTSTPWVDFVWATDCPDGYEPMYNTWLGTVEGNYTRDGVEKTDSQWDG